MWITLTLIVPGALAVTLGGLVTPGGGLVIVKNGGATAMVDIVTHRDSVATIHTLCSKASECKVLGSWSDDGDLAGAQYDEMKDGKLTDKSTLVKADNPFDKTTYIAKIGHAQDVHGFAGHGERVKIGVGGKPPLDRVGHDSKENIRGKRRSSK